MRPPTAEKTATSAVTRCPVCGLVAAGIRCERCNSLKVTGCTGSCLGCRVKGCPVPAAGPGSQSDAS